jgi:poly-beta-1,6-N-acetyl-D-glucosamine synthase
VGRTARRVDQQRPAPTPAAAPRAVQRRLYVPVPWKLALAQAVALGWLGVSVWLSLLWLGDLAGVVGPFPAVLVVALVAYLPGWLVAFLAASLLLDRQPPIRATHPTVPVTVLIAARNEAERIEETITYIARQDYPGPIRVLLADNGSTDGTRAIAGLEAVETELVITLDADTLLHPRAIRQLVARLLSSPADVKAVAGSVLVRNSRDNLWTRMQEWDYFLGIASVKRMQGLYQGTLVAQGAFSLYRTRAVLAVGGWPDAIGEDIVLTWQLMRQGARVYYEPSAVAFTVAPASLVHFARQRARWARGMIEGLRSVKPWSQPRWLLRFLTGIDLLIPTLDVAYSLVWLPACCWRRPDGSGSSAPTPRPCCR